VGGAIGKADNVVMSALEVLRKAVGPAEVIDGDAIDPRFLRDWVVPMSAGRPLALVRPKTTAEVSDVVRICHDARIPVVPQGGLTGLAGGATPVDGCVVLSLDRMTGVEDIDEAAATLTALAGTPLQAIQEAARAAGFLFALDLGARGSCQIGGNVATNAGGNRVIRYGMTRDLVLGLEVVLADGTVMSSLNKLIKNNAGFDLRQLFVGSEGTLGIITRVVLRLHAQPRSQCTAFCSVGNYEQVLGLLRHAREWLGGSLSAFEVMWPDFYDLMTGPEGGVPPPLARGAGAYVLVEAFGSDAVRDPQHFEEMLAAAVETDLVVDGVVAHAEAEARSFWRVRDASGEFPRLGWPSLGFDIGIPTRDIGRFVDECGQAVRARWPGATTAFFGHIGDSNLHLHVKLPSGGADTDVPPLVYDLVRRWRGTTSAEHGIGTLRRPYLSYTRSAEEIALMRQLKHALDPRGILNPGKVIP
jgi:FAD/FMN-containing dehydrogenase